MAVQESCTGCKQYGHSKQVLVGGGNRFCNGTQSCVITDEVTWAWHRCRLVAFEVSIRQRDGLLTSGPLAPGHQLCKQDHAVQCMFKFSTVQGL